MKKALLMTLLLFSVCLVYGQSKKFKAGDKVEVKYEGEWIEATYVMNLGEKFSNMKKTPHKASFKNAFVSGASMFSDADIRAYTGTIKPLFTPQPKASTVNANELEDAIIAEINTMRANPQAYADKLALLKSKYVLASGSYWYLDIPGEGGMYIADSESARKDHERWLDETIADLRKSPVLSQLKKDERLRVSSHYLASDRGTINGPAHTDSKGRGAQDRAKLAGYTHGVNECLVGGYTSAYGFVTSFLIDWKVESRGHRKNLMEPNINDIGVACGYFPNTDGGYIRNVIQGGYRRADDSLIGSSDTDISINKPRIEKPKIEKPVIEEPVIEKPKIEKPLKNKGEFSLEYVSGDGQSYGGGGMPSAMVFKVKEKSGEYVTDLRAKGLMFEVTANKDGGKYDGTFNNWNDYCKNGDKACYGGYYYVPSNRGGSPYILVVEVILKRGDDVIDSYVIKQSIK